MRRNVIPASPSSARQLRSEQRGSYRTPRPAGNPLTVFAALLAKPAASQLWGCALCCCSSFSSRVSLHSGTSGSNGGGLAPYTVECPGASQQSSQLWVMADSRRTPHTLHQCCAKASEGTLESSGTEGASSSTTYLCCSSTLLCTVHRFLVPWKVMGVTAKKAPRCPLRRNFGKQLIPTTSSTPEVLSYETEKLRIICFLLAPNF